MTIKYLAVDYSDNAGANPEVFDSLKEANACIENKWNHLTDSEKEHSHYYAAKVTEEDLVEDGDWTSFEDYEDGVGFFDSDQIGSVKVEFDGGESRQNPGQAVDYMLATFTDDDGEEIELYAEMVNDTYDEETDTFTDDFATFKDLRWEIEDQAEAAGLHPSRLGFAEEIVR